jgi:hypothetical protein
MAILVPQEILTYDSKKISIAPHILVGVCRYVGGGEVARLQRLERRRGGADDWYCTSRKVLHKKQAF